MSRRVLSSLAVAALGLFAACTPDVSALRDVSVPGAAATVHILDSPESVGIYAPAFVEVHPGDVVAFVNASGDFHTITFVGGPADAPSSAGVRPGGTFTTRFETPGAYRYRCLYHSGMAGEVDVVAGSSPPPPPTVSPPAP